MKTESLLEKESTDAVIDRLSLMPESEEAITQLSTSEIIVRMHDFDLAAMDIRLETPEQKESWSGLHERFKLLQKELDVRIANIEIPETYTSAAREFITRVTAETDYKKWQIITADWSKLSESDPLYKIALKFAETDLPLNTHNRDFILKEAHKLVKTYFEHLAGVR